MASRPWQWLVFFFTRPIRLSDLSTFAARMKRRPEPASLPVASAAPIEVPSPRPSPVRERSAPRKESGPSVVSSMFYPELEIGVSEQPIDTLPAELRDELERPGTGRLQGSLRDV